VLPDARVVDDGTQPPPIGDGQIAELANDWDGYAGEIPKSSALAADVLKQYGYATSAFGKWHNTPAVETTAAGPFHNWPTEIGFEYCYGFLAGEASQYDPNLVRNTTSVLPPKTPEEGYHLSEDLADDASPGCTATRRMSLISRSSCIGPPAACTARWSGRARPQLIPFG
jgi:arylsulfatase A-like enzyme